MQSLPRYRQTSDVIDLSTILTSNSQLIVSGVNGVLGKPALLHVVKAINREPGLFQRKDLNVKETTLKQGLARALDAMVNNYIEIHYLCFLFYTTYCDL